MQLSPESPVLPTLAAWTPQDHGSVSSAQVVCWSPPPGHVLEDVSKQWYTGEVVKLVSFAFYLSGIIAWYSMF